MQYFDEVSMLRGVVEESLRDEAYAACLPHAQRLVKLHKENENDKNMAFANDLYTLGFVFGKLHRYEHAAECYRDAAKLSAELVGKGAFLASCQTSLGANLSRAGMHDKAIAALTEAYAVRERILGTRHVDTADSMYNLGNAYLDAGKPQDALTWHARAYECRRETPYAAADSLICMAYAYEALEMRQEAIAYTAKALRLRSKLASGENGESILHAYTLELLYFARLCDDAEDYVKAARAFGKAAQLIQQEASENHMHYAITLAKQAEALAQLEQTQKAISVLKRALKLMRRNVGEEHMACAGVLRSLALLLKKEEAVEEAAEMMHASLRIRERLLGAGHYDYISNVMWLCGLFIEAKRYDRAHEVLKDAIDSARQRGEDTALEQMEELFKIYLILSEIQRMKADEQVSNDQLMAYLQRFFGDDANA